MNRTRLAIVGALALLSAANPARAQEPAAPTVLWACYVPLTGTVYRIAPEGISGLRTDCSSTSHVKFSWNQQGPAGPAGGGVSGYEVATVPVSNTYNSNSVSLVITGQLCVSQHLEFPNVVCDLYAWTYHLTRSAPAVTVNSACPAGKKAFGAFLGGDLSSDINTDGTMAVSIPARSRSGPQAQVVSLAPPAPPYPQAVLPSTNPDTYSVKLVCASAS
jgi:hypothetical protein